MVRKAVLLALVFAILSGCTTEATPIPAPTQPLATLAPSPTPLPPTATFTPNAALIDPLTLGQPTATAPDFSPTESWQQDPVAGQLVELAQRRVATTLDIPTIRVRVVDVRVFTWEDTSLGCPQAGESYTPVQADGYRIVLNAVDQDYIFHTDFDRVIPCDAKDEALPGVTPEATVSDATSPTAIPLATSAVEKTVQPTD
jgi:hypothetical protein